MNCLKLCLSALALGVAAMAFGGDKDAPAWVAGVYEDLPASYVKTVTGEGMTPENAIQNAVEQVYKGRANEAGTIVDISGGGRTASQRDKDLMVKSRIIDQYIEKIPGNRYRATVLVQVATNPYNQFEDVKVTDRYGFTPKVLVPGMAQLAKGSTGKGIAFIAAEALCVGGIIVGECQRSSYNSKLSTTHSPENLKHYADQANNWGNVRNVCIGAAAAVYVWNVVDGIVAKGRKHVVADGKTIAFTPYYDFNYDAVGLAMTVNF